MRIINKRIFEGCVGFFSAHSKAKTALAVIYKVLPNLMIFAYVGLLIYAHFLAKQALPRLVGAPLGVLIVVSLLRVIINAERPYERFGVPSVFGKQTVRKSMPSRHTASAFIIAAAFTYVNPVWGAFAFAAAALIALSRIAAGSHYISDVAVAIIISMTIAYLFFFI